MKHIMKCPGCGRYSLMENCASCHLATVIPRPVRFSPEDHYAAYRRRAKESVLREKGWL